MLKLYRRAAWQLQLLTIILIVAALVVIGFLGLQQFQAGDPGEQPPTSKTVDIGGAAAILPAGERPFGLHVLGEGEVIVTPDRSIVELGVEASASTAAAAAEQASATAERLVAAVREISSNPEDIQIQTTGISLAPVFPPVQAQPRPQSANPVGYRSSNTITITIDQLDLTSSVLDAALAAGANTVHSISFTLKSDGPAKERALRLAVLDAANKARVAAEALQGSVRGLISLNEEYVHVPVARSTRSAFPEAAMSSGSVPVEAGQLRIRATVRANFAYE
ncbi:MAG TPA: SIMPL domain-containing protein [Acidobacteriota bacterium]|jgi:hypothetical protein|nr:SIMPL domain-containing protein [Acidobacteriota bacterium]